MFFQKLCLFLFQKIFSLNCSTGIVENRNHLSFGGCEIGFGVTDFFHAPQQVSCARYFSAPWFKMPWMQFSCPLGMGDGVVKEKKKAKYSHNIVSEAVLKQKT